jgi:Skp family chaperone for outer membrane proteins
MGSILKNNRNKFVGNGEKMKKLIIALAALGMFLSFTGTAIAQKGIKIGIVDVQAVAKEIPESIEAENILLDLSKKFQDTLLLMQKDLEQKFAQYQKQKTMMTADQQKKEEEALQAQNMQLMRYKEEKFGQVGDLAKNREKLLEPIRKKVRDAIEKVAKKEKMNMVVDKGSAFLLYAEDKLDITYSVLDAIKRGKK